MKLLSIRTTAQEIYQLLADHAEKVSSGKISSIDDDSIRISENINRDLKKHVESFIADAARVFKHGVQNLAKFFNINIGFLYIKNDGFQKGIKALENSEQNLSHYLREVRKWSEKLTKIRIAMEHDLHTIPDVTYSENSGLIQIKEPDISGKPVTEFIKFIFDRLACFTEDITIYCLQKKLPTKILFLEIPKSNRNPEMPVRFRVGLAINGVSR